VLLQHRTRYRYDRPVTLGPQTIRLRPAPHTPATISSYRLTILPEGHSLHRHQDPSGNFLARVLFASPVTCFEIGVELQAEIGAANPFDFFLEPEVADWPFRYPEDVAAELAPFRVVDAAGPEFAGLVAGIPTAGQPTIEVLTQSARIVKERVSYQVRLEAGVQTPEETLAWGMGSCRDSAWLLVQLLRWRGFAARFVSGYLIQLAGDVGGTGERPPDTADLHAWAEAYLPGAGWIGLDSTSGLLTSEEHIPLAASLGPASAAPISGTVEHSVAEFEVITSVARLPGNGQPDATEPR
jgi:transglutaminase-like putative cysteine protease